MTLATLLACSTLLSQELSDPVLLLAKVRKRMTDALAQETNYTCLVSMERSSKSALAKPWRRTDTVRFEIANVGGRELFAWHGQAQFEQSIRTALPYGVVSTGEYALHARAVFTDGYSNIRFAGNDAVGGRNALRWNFTIPLFGSGWYITHHYRRVRVGSHGSFWVNPSTLNVIRLEMYADDLPVDFANSAVATWTDYGRIQLGSLNALLPESSGVILEERSGKGFLNLLEFSHCRQYSAESSVRFSDDAPKGAPQTSNRAATKPAELPAGLVLDLKLSTPIDSATAAVGDRVDAVSISDVIHRGAVVVPGGTIFHGRVRRIEKREGNPGQFAVGLEFFELTLSGQRIRFIGVLERLKPEIKGFRKIAGPSRLVYQESSISEQIYDLPAVPGVATLIFVGSSFQIPEGSIMNWRTQKLRLAQPKP